MPQIAAAYRVGLLFWKGLLTSLMSQMGHDRSFGDVGSMSGLRESGPTFTRPQRTNRPHGLPSAPSMASQAGGPGPAMPRDHVASDSSPPETARTERAARALDQADRATSTGTRGTARDRAPIRRLMALLRLDAHARLVARAVLAAHADRVS
jgi:hypothetical protein